ncbi:50S ribosomal protein L19 [Patescibacteria group bacterium]|nr:50S ribosomal protein L19 [Patescibacteria group bacterium]
MEAKEGEDKTESEFQVVKNHQDLQSTEESLQLKPGMTIRIYELIKELNSKGEEKQRTQYFEGIILKRKHGNEPGATITVRKISNGVGIEKIFPLHLPTITKIEIKKQARVRKANLDYLKRSYKKRLKEKRVEKVYQDTSVKK